jgi:ferric-dicitrate binding protein FerR (iron transport regulator)
MTASRYAELAARILRQGARPSSPPPCERSSDAALQALEQAILLRGLRRQKLQVWAAVAAGVGLAAGAFTAERLSRSSPAASVLEPLPRVAVVAGTTFGNGEARVVHADGTSSLIDGEVLDPGSRFLTSAGTRAELRMTTGTRIELQEKTEIRVVEMGPVERFYLGGGAARADVAKLRVGERFVVGTADAEVEVHGTSFLLELRPPDPSCPGSPATHLKVYEGVVTVRANGWPEVRVPRGGEWPSGCLRTSTAAVAEQPTETERRNALARNAGLHDANGAKPASRAGASSPSALAEQNGLFAQAMAAKRRGDIDEAVGYLDQLVSLHPTTPLLESALAERMKILRPRDGARARAAAREYLRSYPAGFAREEAGTILSEAP